ncbi:ABC transporter permease [Amphibacillus cookii]|uniref:ABC transporter permease n=1 Tax=Amphibacillus cookii TaxID=767787 RepID=UPI001956C757|nr:ABC transporter permease [Amphibacillus cookii]MBM7539804.1 ABC-2 type transport system permease protein [Amphibacillus cookii]
MMQLCIARLMLWKQHVLSYLFWLWLPLIGTLLFVPFIQDVSDEFLVPIGIVLEEETELAQQLYQTIAQVDTVNAEQFEEREAIRRLNRNQLDSVYLIPEGYQERIEHGEQRHLVEAYYTEHSLAYPYVKELVTSTILADTGKVKAESAVVGLAEAHQQPDKWNSDEILATAEQFYQASSILSTDLTISGEDQSLAEHDELKLYWQVWVLLSTLSTLFLFDWIITEKSQHVRIRFQYMKVSYRCFLLISLMMLLIMLLLVDGLTLVVLNVYRGEQLSILTLFSYRVMIAVFSFLLAMIWKNRYLYQATAISFVLWLTLINSSFKIEGEGHQLIQSMLPLNPLRAFLNDQASWRGLMLAVVGLVLWYAKEGGFYARNKRSN